MNFVNDVSINTIIISVVVAIVGWILKGVAWALGEIGKRLIETLISTTTKVEVLDAKMVQVLQAVADVQKLKADMNAAYSRIKSLEDNH